ncbi:MAG: Holliday junction resolvase RuvX [Longimicrobiaceae bacterium]
MGRVIGFDYGARRLGVALSDPTRTLATPLGTLVRREGKRIPWAALARLLDGRETDLAVVGLPLELGGEEGAWALETRAFGAEVERKLGCPVRFVDERMTSLQAERLVRSSGLSRTRREEKERVDSAAAAVILQHFLDSKR